MDKEMLTEYQKLIEKETPDFYHKRRNEIREMLTETSANETVYRLKHTIEKFLSIELSHLANIINTIIPSKEFNSKIENLIHELSKAVMMQISVEMFKSDDQPEINIDRKRKNPH